MIALAIAASMVAPGVAVAQATVATMIAARAAQPIGIATYRVQRTTAADLDSLSADLIGTDGVVAIGRYRRIDRYDPARARFAGDRSALRETVEELDWAADRLLFRAQHETRTFTVELNGALVTTSPFVDSGSSSQAFEAFLRNHPQLATLLGAVQSDLRPVRTAR